MSEELEIGESTVLDDDGPLTVEMTRTGEHTFTKAYKDPDTGERRLVVRLDVTTGSTAIDPRRVDESYWTLIVRGVERPISELEQAIRTVPSPGVEVAPEEQEIRVYSHPEEETRSS